uniref:Uncharacterized protein n=1 Tax=Oryza punctata TaxID=4537 RepID=A0A0E0KPG5_ORYPU
MCHHLPRRGCYLPPPSWVHPNLDGSSSWWRPNQTAPEPATEEITWLSPGSGSLGTGHCRYP